jgi:beta-glucanase (GH16 family)
MMKKMKNMNLSIISYWIIISSVALLHIFMLINCSGDESGGSNISAPTDSIPSPPGWKLVWNDEFSGSSLDPAKWEYEVNGQGGGNNELQYYTDREINSFISSGNLVIRAMQESYTGPDGTREYTSARIRTKNKGDWKYGRFTIKAKLPYGQGLWPAIWMLPTDWEYGGWAASGEIDIMELVGHEPNKVHGTLHYGGSYPANTQSGGPFTLPSGSFSDSYHEFTLEWEETEFRWYVDGNLYLTQTDWFTNAAPYPAPFDKKFHLILNVAVGGNWPGSPDQTTKFPQTMVIDYVRIYEKVE